MRNENQLPFGGSLTKKPCLPVGAASLAGSFRRKKKAAMETVVTLIIIVLAALGWCKVSWQNIFPDGEEHHRARDERAGYHPRQYQRGRVRTARSRSSSMPRESTEAKTRAGQEDHRGLRRTYLMRIVNELYQSSSCSLRNPFGANHRQRVQIWSRPNCSKVQK